MAINSDKRCGLCGGPAPFHRDGCDRAVDRLLADLGIESRARPLARPVAERIVATMTAPVPDVELIPPVVTGPGGDFRRPWPANWKGGVDCTSRS